MIQYDSQEALLLAYVDGCLSEAESARVEKQLAGDTELRNHVTRLQQSTVPFRQAFDAQLDDAIPQKLIDFIEHWEDGATPTESVKSVHWQDYLGRVAVLIIGVLLGFSLSISSQDSNQDTAGSWLRQVASYHELYVRETVELARFDPLANLRLTETFQQALNTEFSIPNLQAQQLDFKRGQLLQIDGSPLAQIAYLPKDGPPVVLCFTRRADPDHDFRFGLSHNLRYVSWARDGVSYLLLGSMSFDEMNAIAQQAANQL